MNRLAFVLVAAIGATLTGSCTNPVDETSITAARSRPVPPGDGHVTRMPLRHAATGIAVASAGYAYITQADLASRDPATIARVDLNARAVTDTIPVGRVPSL